jgi:hypothetical protein
LALSRARLEEHQTFLNIADMAAFPANVFAMACSIRAPEDALKKRRASYPIKCEAQASTAMPTMMR